MNDKNILLYNRYNPKSPKYRYDVASVPLTDDSKKTETLLDYQGVNLVDEV